MPRYGISSAAPAIREMGREEGRACRRTKTAGAGLQVCKRREREKGNKR